jgi:hypothetical protein
VTTSYNSSQRTVGSSREEPFIVAAGNRDLVAARPAPELDPSPHGQPPLILAYFGCLGVPRQPR